MVKLVTVEIPQFRDNSSVVTEWAETMELAVFLRNLFLAKNYRTSFYFFSHTSLQFLPTLFAAFCS